GLTQNTSLISIGFVAENNQQFYAEFIDYNQSQCDDWIKTHVIQNCRWLNTDVLPDSLIIENKNNCLSVCGNKIQIKEQLSEWLKQFKSVEIWADCYAYDWVLFCELFGGALHIPGNVFYMPADISTLFLLKGLDMDIDRETFSELELSDELHKHNALYDALVTRACYEKLLSV
ncbi:MAG TPA: hypothetical protein ENJ28_02745, partial [Gammaproteobacteria bacterium]|nr:hypothetical protein [Gammaproteobacteria bacterium]